jgi:hypothetical protein
MNNTLLSLGLIFMLIVTSSIIGNFFDIKLHYYLPLVLWGIALCIFNLLLEKEHINEFV